MTTLLLTLIAILVGDLALKAVLHRAMGTAAISLGALGSIQLADGRLWLRQLRKAPGAYMLWGVWVAAAATLAAGSQWIPLSPMFAGLLLGGSLGNAVEHAQRGAISDYVRLRFWPAFNLADAAIALGATGIVAQLLLRLAA